MEVTLDCLADVSLLYRDTQRREPCKDTGRRPGATWSHQQLGKAVTGCVLEPSEGAQPCLHLDFGAAASRIQPCCFKASSLRSPETRGFVTACRGSQGFAMLDAHRSRDT